jgi:hypothetical protein
MEAEGWPSVRCERFKDETLQAFQRRAHEIQQIVEGFRMGRYRGDAAEQMEQRLIRLQEQGLEPVLLSA